jgi:eukaryotic-like serine/threonine-protein kinase
MPETPERTRLGPYRLLAVRHRGGDDILYRARHETRDVEVALRVRTLTDAVESLDARELIRLQALVHPNVVRILDVGQAEDCAYVALEPWAEDLAPLRQGTAQPFADRVRLVEEICAGMAAAHFVGVVHGNLHPFQVRLAHDGRAQVDFSERVASATGGLLVGNPTYLCPEQIRGQPADARSDVFSTGCVAYEMLTGRKPFEGESLLLYKIIFEAPPPPQPFAPEMSPALGDWLLRSLAKEPEQRFQNGHEMVEALRVLRRPN